MSQGIRLVVFDLAGTTVDHGCFAPVMPFTETLRRHGIAITPAEARAPMGLAKRDHLRALLELEGVRGQWRELHRGDWTESDVDRLYHEDFVPLQMEAVHRHCELIPGVLETVAALREQRIAVATTTGYFGEAAAVVHDAIRRQGFTPDVSLCVDDVSAGRPAPWMLFRCMEAAGVLSTRSVLKVGDTVPDVGEGRNAGAWTLGVWRTGSEVGLTLDEWRALSADEQEAHHRRVDRVLYGAGVHGTLESVADLPEMVQQFNARMGFEERVWGGD